MARKDWRVTRPTVLLDNIPEFFEGLLAPNVRQVLRKRGLSVKKAEGFSQDSGEFSLALNLLARNPDIDFDGDPPNLSAEDAGDFFRTGLLNLSTKEKISGGVKGSTLLHLKKADWVQAGGVAVFQTFSFDGATTNITEEDPQRIVCDYSKLDFEAGEGPELFKPFFNAGEVSKILIQKVLSPTFSISNLNDGEIGDVYCSAIPGPLAFLGLFGDEGPGIPQDLKGEVFSNEETEATLKVEFYSYPDDDDKLNWGIKVSKISVPVPVPIIQADWNFDYSFFIQLLESIYEDVSEWGAFEEANEKSYEERHFRLSISSAVFPAGEERVAGDYSYQTFVDEIKVEEAEGNEQYGESSNSIILFEDLPLFTLFALSIASFEFFIIFGR
jgi:hypothetical protein